MTKQELMAQHPELYSQVTTEAETGLRAEFEKEKTAMQARHEKEQGDVTARLKELEKAELIRAQREINMQAEMIWAQALSESGLQGKSRDKIRKHVDTNAFVKDGTLDAEGFQAAVRAEIAEWEADINHKVQGFGALGAVAGSGVNAKDPVTGLKEDEAAALARMSKKVS